MRDPYLDKPQLSRFWGKIKSVLFTPLSERVTDHENTTDAMQNCATTILEKCISADGRFFETDYDARLHDLDAVIVSCDTLLQYINLSFKKKYISGDQCHYWAELVRPVKQKASNWRRTDSNRAATLREAKAAQELAKMSQMALQIAEAVRHT